MATNVNNKITVNFTPCESAPFLGYAIYYKAVGASEYTFAGNFTSSPAVFYDNLNPSGTVFVGYIVARVTEDSKCPQISFTTGEHINGGEIINSTPFSGINSIYVSTPSAPDSALPVATVSGFPLASGTSTTGLLPAPFTDAFVDVYCYVDPTTGTSIGLYLKVTDSDGNVHCQPGSLVPVIVINSVRLSNTDNFTIELTNVPC
jgi:hypothetical protein